jgi:hypothetical protein
MFFFLKEDHVILDLQNNLSHGAIHVLIYMYYQECY